MQIKPISMIVTGGAALELVRCKRFAHGPATKARPMTPAFQCLQLSQSLTSVIPRRRLRRLAAEMRIGLLVLYMSSALGGRYAVAQDLIGHEVLGAACIDVNQTAMNHIAVGRLKDAESILSAALADRATGSEQSCAWLTLHNLAPSWPYRGGSRKPRSLSSVPSRFSRRAIHLTIRFC